MPTSPRRVRAHLSLALVLTLIALVAGASASSSADALTTGKATASAKKKKKRARAHSRCARRSTSRRRATKRSRRCVRSRAAALGVTITSGPSGSTSQTSATFGWSVTGRVSKVSCSLDGGALVACSSPKSYSGLAAGSHTFRVRVSKGGTSASDSATWTVTTSTSTPPPPPPPAAACSDGADNDGDSKVDYPADPGCTGTSDADEADPPPPSTNLVFNDDFSGAAGAPADPARWMLRGNYCDGNLNYTCAKDSNVFQDGLGNLVVRTKREASNYLGGGPFSGGWVETFAYGTGWPPSPVKAAWAVPYRIEMRAKFPNVAGAWGGGWNMNVDRPTSQNIYELDWSEERMTFPTSADCHQHTWLSGRDVGAWDCSPVAVSNMGLNWHVFSADVYTDRVVYKVDGITRGAAPGVSGRHGLIVNMGIAAPGSWGSGGQQPAASDPGPWDLLVDYVRVSAL